MLGLKYFKELRQLNDSIAGTKVFWNVDKIHAEQLEKKNREILDQKEATISQQHRANMYLKISGTLGIALLLGLAFNVFLVRRKNRVINEQKDELNVFNEQLLQGLDERDLELQSTRDAIDRIVSRISHDVRGKVATLKLLSLLAEKESREDDEYYSKISDTIRDTDVTLEWLTSFSRIKNRDLKLVDINLRELIEGLLPGVLEVEVEDTELVSDRIFIFNLLEMIDDRKGIRNISLSTNESEIVMAIRFKEMWRKKQVQNWTKYLTGPEDINADAEELVILSRAITERLGGNITLEAGSKPRTAKLIISLPKVHKLTLNKSISSSSS